MVVTSHVEVAELKVEKKVEDIRRSPGPIATPGQLLPPRFFNTDVSMLIAQQPLQLQSSYFNIL